MKQCMVPFRGGFVEPCYETESNQAPHRDLRAFRVDRPPTALIRQAAAVVSAPPPIVSAPPPAVSNRHRRPRPSRRARRSGAARAARQRPPGPARTTAARRPAPARATANRAPAPARRRRLRRDRACSGDRSGRRGASARNRDSVAPVETARSGMAKSKAAIVCLAADRRRAAGSRTPSSCAVAGPKTTSMKNLSPSTRPGRAGHRAPAGRAAPVPAPVSAAAPVFVPSRPPPHRHRRRRRERTGPRGRGARSGRRRRCRRRGVGRRLGPSPIGPGSNLMRPVRAGTSQDDAIVQSS